MDGCLGRYQWTERDRHLGRYGQIERDGRVDVDGLGGIDIWVDMDELRRTDFISCIQLYDLRYFHLILIIYTQLYCFK